MRPAALPLLPLLLVAALTGAGAEPEAELARIPVIYCSDLFHPHDDPDDHFDLACLYALPELEVLGIVLDQGDRQDRAPGRIPVSQMNGLTGRNVPCATGLSTPLGSPRDTGADQPAAHQRGIELMLRSLEAAKEPVTIITVGSVRDVAAAFNRAPDLFFEKVSRLLIFIGAVDTVKPEWNVNLDPHAFVRVMNSGLPVHWVPCFDGGLFKNAGRASFWRASHAELLAGASDRVLNYFVYALGKKEDPDPLGFLSREAAPEDVAGILEGKRNLWCTAVFPFVAGRKFVLRDGEWRSVPPDEVREGEETVTPFRFQAVSLAVGADAKVIYGDSEHAHRVHRFEVVDRERYAEAMTSITAHLLRSLDPDPPR